MLKNILKLVLNILTVIVLFVLQLYVFNNIYIFGARFNVVAVYIIIISMLCTLKVSLPINLVVGLLTDVVLNGGRLQYLLIFMIIAIVLESLKLLYKQDSSKSVAVYSAAGIIVLEIVSCVFSAIRTGITINIFSHMFFVLKALAINIPLAYVMYVIAIKINDKLER